jgi:hypothetical protein
MFVAVFTYLYIYAYLAVYVWNGWYEGRDSSQVWYADFLPYLSFMNPTS